MFASKLFMFLIQRLYNYLQYQMVLLVYLNHTTKPIVRSFQSHLVTVKIYTYNNLLPSSIPLFGYDLQLHSFTQSGSFKTPYPHFTSTFPAVISSSESILFDILSTEQGFSMGISLSIVIGLLVMALGVQSGWCVIHCTDENKNCTSEAPIVLQTNDPTPSRPTPKTKRNNTERTDARLKTKGATNLSPKWSSTK
ncbi:hypothetical protein AGLY_014415 [Aphis glycines]|uniref:Uncharacterized protein n=1 Tax=Aphis glycines TaxID=307491 RepID=A0A6G0T5I0_APHGL|nr:hypothetical protein AGLY_014415 [Aphis glycines]